MFIGTLALYTSLFYCARYVVAISLAEAETLRKIIHSNQRILSTASLALHSLDGRILDASDNYTPHVKYRFNSF